MVSRRDKYRDAHLSERGKQRLAGLGVGAAAVQKISGKEQEIGISLVYLRRDALQKRSLLAAADGRLFRVKRFKG